MVTTMFTYHCFLPIAILSFLGTTDSNPVCSRGTAVIAGKCYTFGGDRTSWDAVLKHCLQQKMELESINSDELLQELDTRLSFVYIFHEFVWTDVQRSLTGWQFNSNNMPINISMWNTGEPNNAGGNENCAAKQRGNWFDVKCNHGAYGVCQSDECPPGCDEDTFEHTPPEYETCSKGVVKLTDTGKCYYVDTSRTVTWDEASASCKDMSGVLANTNHNYEQLDKYILSLPKAGWNNFWIAGTRNGSRFYSENGELIDQDRWAPNEPNNHQNKENCIQYRYWVDREEMTWNDNQCSSQGNFICEINECPSDCGMVNNDEETTTTVTTTTTVMTTTVVENDNEDIHSDDKDDVEVDPSETAATTDSTESASTSVEQPPDSVDATQQVNSAMNGLVEQGLSSLFPGSFSPTNQESGNKTKSSGVMTASSTIVLSMLMSFAIVVSYC